MPLTWKKRAWVWGKEKRPPRVTEDRSRLFTKTLLGQELAKCLCLSDWRQAEEEASQWMEESPGMGVDLEVTRLGGSGTEFLTRVLPGFG